MIEKRMISRIARFCLSAEKLAAMMGGSHNFNSNEVR